MEDQTVNVSDFVDCLEILTPLDFDLDISTDDIIFCDFQPPNMTEASSSRSIPNTAMAEIPQNPNNDEIRKKPRAPRKYVPEDDKDEAYRGKRKKNNESAQRCRAKKRNKIEEKNLGQRHDSLAQKIDELVNAALSLKAEHEGLKSDVDNLQGLLTNNVE